MVWTKGMLAVAAGVALTAMAGCSSSSPGAQAPLPAATSHATPTPASSTTSAADSPSVSPASTPYSPAGPPTPAVALAPPKTPETVAGAEQVTRAYFAALNEVNAKGDVPRAEHLPDYVLPSCQLCVAFDRNLIAYAMTVRQVHGRPVGGVNTVTSLSLSLDRELAHTAVGSVRFSTTANALLDLHGKPLVQGPAGPLRTYFLYLTYTSGQWRLSRLLSTS